MVGLLGGLLVKREGLETQEEEDRRVEDSSIEDKPKLNLEEG